MNKLLRNQLILETLEQHVFLFWNYFTNDTSLESSITCVKKHFC